MESQRPSPPTDPLPNWVAWGLLGVLLTTGLIAVGLDWEDWRGYTLALAVSMCFLGWGMWRSTRRPVIRAYQAEVDTWRREQRAAGRSRLQVEWDVTRDTFATQLNVRSRVGFAVILVLTIYSGARAAGDIIGYAAG